MSSTPFGVKMVKYHGPQWVNFQHPIKNLRHGKISRPTGKPCETRSHHFKFLKVLRKYKVTYDYQISQASIDQRDHRLNTCLKRSCTTPRKQIIHISLTQSTHPQPKPTRHTETPSARQITQKASPTQTVPVSRQITVVHATRHRARLKS